MSDEILRRLTRLEIMFEASLGGPMCSVAEARGDRGSPVVHFDPKQWRGPSFKGRRYADCPAAYLDVLAETLDYMGAKEDAEGKTYRGKPSGPYKRQDAARARRWALMKRLGDAPDVAPEADQPRSAFGGGASAFGSAGGFGAPAAADLADDDALPVGPQFDVEDEIPF